jgi:hypothetical protein
MASSTKCYSVAWRFVRDVDFSESTLANKTPFVWGRFGCRTGGEESGNW